jgi:Saxitoxin biosynthesis operon protein SxtJ
VARGSATHERLIADGEIRSSSNRVFGFVFVAFLTIVGGGRFLTGRSAGWYLGAAAVLLLVSVARPGLLAPLNRAWTWLGMVLHRCVSPIVLGLVFYTTLTPIGLLLRLTGKDVLRLRLDRDASTYWIERRPPGPQPETMRHQF